MDGAASPAAPCKSTVLSEFGATGHRADAARALAKSVRDYTGITPFSVAPRSASRSHARAVLSPDALTIIHSAASTAMGLICPLSSQKQT